MVAKQSTKRKTTTKKTPAKKQAPARSRSTKVVTAKKAPARKRTTARKTTAKRNSKMVSFRVYRDSTPFSNTSVTRQTVYWAILLLVIVLMQLWILKIQVEIADLTNSILSQSL